ncbi:MAG: right-handed parallel beta-helix repeat-containing protein [Cytophagales bacterium]
MNIKVNLLFSIVFFCGQIFAKNYYVSQNGNDLDDGLSPMSPIQSIVKVNSLKLFPGDSILFKRGEKFVGNIKITNSGDENSEIVLGAYGQGEFPIISAAITIQNWTLLNKNIYTANFEFNLKEITQIFIDEVIHIPARYPNNSYMKIKNISDSSFNVPEWSDILNNWDSAYMHVRTEHWVIDKFLIITQKGKNFKYSKPKSFYKSYDLKENFGFFLSNKISALDTIGEFYFDYNNKKIYIISKNNQSLLNKGAEISIYTNCVTIAPKVKHIKIENLQLEKSLKDALFLDKTEFVSIHNCNIKQTGRDGVGAFEDYNTSNEYLNISKCQFSDISNVGINVPNSQKTIITNNKIKRCGLIAGLGQCYDEAYSGIVCTQAKVYYNTIDSVGYSGIIFKEKDTISYNTVSNIGQTKNDCGAYYGWKSSDNVISHNFANLGYSNGEGTIYQNNTLNVGLYCDDYSHHNTFVSNTIENHEIGAMIHNSANIIFKANVFYNNFKAQLQLLEGAPFSSKLEVYDNLISNNIFQSMHPSQMTLFLSSEKNNLNSFGIFSGNYYSNTYRKNHIGLIYRPDQSDTKYSNRYIGISLKELQNMFKYDLDAKSAFDSLSSYANYIKKNSNMIQNSNFEKGTGWWWTYENENFLITTQEKSGFEKLTLKGVYSDSLNIKQGNWGTAPLKIESGKKYMLTYQILGQTKGGFRVNLNSSDDPYGGVVLPASHYKQFDKEMISDTILVKGNINDNASLTFNSTNFDKNFWMDKVQFFEIEEDTTLSLPFYKTVLFKNLSNTELTLNVKNKYRFLSGEILQDNYILKSYESIVLKRLNSFIDNHDDDLYEKELNFLYPNPVNECFKITKSTNFTSDFIEITNQSGVLLFKGKLDGTDFVIPQHWTNGIYFISVIRNNYTYKVKWILER